MFLTALLLLAQPPPVSGLPDPVAPIAAICRIGPERLALEQWREATHGVDGPVVVVNGSAPLAERQLLCLAEQVGERALHIAFEDMRLGASYSVTNARQFLRTHGRLRRLPRHDSRGESLAAFAARLEAHCGARRGSVLVIEEGSIRLRPHDTARYRDSDFIGRYCAMQAAIARGHDPLVVAATIWE